MTSMFHGGMRALQDEFDGRRVADALEKNRKHTEFWPDDITLIEQASFFFLATHHGDAVDCSYKGGTPGFVKITGLSSLEWPDYDGNSMYRSLGNIACQPRVALLFIRFDGENTLLRITGAASLYRDAETLSHHHDAKLVVRREADYMFPNCPRYIPALTETLPSPHNPAPGHTPPTGRSTEGDRACLSIPNALSPPIIASRVSASGFSPLSGRPVSTLMPFVRKIWPRSTSSTWAGAPPHNM